jgi:hypothetical protein
MGILGMVYDCFNHIEQRSKLRRGHRLELQISDGPLEGTFLTVGEELGER